MHLQGGSPGAEALELQRVVWQWLQKLPMPRLLQAAFIKGWERRVTRFPESLFRVRASLVVSMVLIPLCVGVSEPVRRPGFGQ